MFLVLHSSAGAGKTHALVKHYLRHCLRTEDHAAYRHVLALTFTNKAAAEMKERVMRYLEQLSKGDLDSGAMRDLLEHLKEASHVDEIELARRADVVLGHMLHHWSDVAISTIDSFTQRVVKPFARDLRLDHDLQMTTEEGYYRDRAVGALIEAAGSDERITRILSAACAQLLHEERSWDPARPLRELSRELQKESSIRPLEQLRSFSLDELFPLIERLRVEEATFRRQVNELGKAALQLFADHGIQEADVAYGKGGILGYFRKLASFTDEWSAPGVQTLKPFDTGKWHSGKADPAAIAALDLIANPLTGLFQKAEQMREGPFRSYLIQRAVARDLMPAFALHELDAKLEELKHDDGVAFFSDLTRRVSEVVKDEPVPFIYERLGEHYRHFLIDEFQDTSLLQWNALLPLIENAISTGGSTLLVGDAKQAIYRWRNGEVRLFVELPKLFGRGNEPMEVQREESLVRSFSEGERLDHNRRSTKRIIALNNALFGSLAELLPEELRKVYDHHDQRDARSELGLVRIDLAEGAARGEEAQQALVDHAQRCLEQAIDAGFAPGEVAVLVRSKRVGRAIAEHFLGLGHAVVSPDGLQLAADPAIQLLIGSLRFLHAGDAASAIQVLQWRAILDGEEDAGTVPLFPPSADPPKPVDLVRRWLRDHGDPRLRTTVSALVAELAHAHGFRPAEDASVLTLLDEVHNWTMDHAQDIGGFLEHWERSGGDRSTAPPADDRAIQVMTVHKSKGLQFPVVIVPDARMSGGVNHGELFWVDPGSAVPELHKALIRDNKTSRGAELPELIEEEGLRTLDALNLLYVAFTRAEHRLYAYVPAATDAVTKGLAEFVRTRPEIAEAAEDAEPAEPTPAATIAGPLIDVSSGNRPELTMRFEAPEDWDPAAPGTQRAYGTAVHAVIAATRTTEDLPKALERAVAIGDLSEKEAATLLLELEPMISSPELRPWFESGSEVYPEAALITADGQSIRPDRMLVEGDRIRVLEIKSGKPSPAHEEQVHSYLDLLREIGHTNVDGTLWYLDGQLRTVV
jgi:ATP-dependent exoDNAse (exonuclease V) beta subunit